MALDRFSGVLNGVNCTLEDDERIGQRFLKITRHYSPTVSHGSSTLSRKSLNQSLDCFCIQLKQAVALIEFGFDAFIEELLDVVIHGEVNDLPARL